MAGIQGLALEDPIVSVMIGGQSITITLANILEVAKLKNELGKAQQRGSDLDVELTAVKERLAMYWTKILEGKVIMDDMKRQLNEEKETTKRLMTALEKEIHWRGMIGTRYYLQGKFLEEVGKDFIEIVGGLSGCLRKKMEGGGEGGGGAGGVREEINLEILKGIPVVLRSLREKIEGGVISERENVISVLGVMKGIIKMIGGEVEVETGSSQQGQSSSPEKEDPEAPPEIEVEEDDLDEYETYIEVVEDEEEPTSGDAGTTGTSDQGLIGFQLRESTSGGGDGDNDDKGEPPAKIAKRKQPALKSLKSKGTPQESKSLKSTATPSCSTAAGVQQKNKHAAHPDNKRMCICGFTCHVTNINKHIWRLTEGRHTTRGPHVCPNCGDRFRARTALVKHVGAHRNGVVKKKEQPEVAKEGGGSVSVVKKVATSTVTCFQCARRFPNRKSLYNHKRKNHYAGSVTKKAVLTNKVVKEVTGSGKAQQQQLHQVDTSKKRSNSSGHYCKCGNHYYSRSALNAHVRKNTQPLQFKCDICEERFLWNSLLVRHLERGHKLVLPKKGGGGEGPRSFSVSCSFCGAQFSKYDELYKHRKAVHGIGKKGN